MERRFISDLDIQALIDQELDHERADQVRAVIQSDPQLKRRYEIFCAQKRLLQDWWSFQNCH